MPVDPFAVLNAMLRAEAARQERSGHRTEAEQEPEPHPVRPVSARSAEPEAPRD
ncbi:hypothetical protein ACIGEZ_17820 [Streptomyces sp. NPDC085481]|uniref:hypothetical protein n=1 Tax=Streptomyces sp. NPDC085481 TaxID=3365727 RepID=UPI0037D0C023